MRISTGAAAVLALLVAAAVFAPAPAGAAPPAGVPQGTPAPAPAEARAGNSTASPTGDAAAKHAKRTACLKAVKAKKLVGADKASFLKNCIASP